MTNQIREKIGVLFGSPETTPGGNAMKYYASIRIDIRKIGQLKDGSGDVIGNRCKVKIIKNKVAPPMKSCEFDILYGEGIDNYGELVDMACDFGILTKKGSWFSYGSENIAQGRSGAVEVLKSNEELFNVIKSEVLLRMYGEVYETEQEEVVESNSQE
jgi:recombination protein RecA